MRYFRIFSANSNFSFGFVFDIVGTGESGEVNPEILSNCRILFDIKRDGSIIVSEQEYINWCTETTLETASHRRVSAELSFEAGGFWSGNRKEYAAEVTLRPYPGIELSPEYIRTNVNLA